MRVEELGGGQVEGEEAGGGEVEGEEAGGGGWALAG